jgi:F0F1-type ATP synthase beta subunit
VNVIGHHSGVSVFCGIGERCREGEELYREVKAAGVLDKSVLVFGQMNESPGARFRTGHAALTMAEYFRDEARQDVQLLIDNIFRFIQAGSEVSGLMGQLPSRLGYQPTLATELADLEERICSTPSAAITSVQAVYVPADDFSDPAPVHTFSHLSASIVLSRKRASDYFGTARQHCRIRSTTRTQMIGRNDYERTRTIRKQGRRKCGCHGHAKRRTRRRFICKDSGSGELRAFSGRVFVSIEKVSRPSDPKAAEKSSAPGPEVHHPPRPLATLKDAPVWPRLHGRRRYPGR